MKKVNIRTALPEDTPLIYDFIMKLAQYHAEPMHEWTVYRLCDKALIQLAKEPLL